LYAHDHAFNDIVAQGNGKSLSRHLVVLAGRALKEKAPIGYLESHNGWSWEKIAIVEESNG
jgi:hypothetical protein